MKKMRKKIWASFMTLVMTVTMLSGMSMTASADDTYDIQVQSAVQFNEDTDYDDAIAGVMYSILGMNAKGWAKDTVKIIAHYRYQIAKDISGPFATSIQYDDETNNGNAIFYISERSTGKIYKGSLAYNIDRTDPVITGIENGKGYCESASFTVTDVALKSVTDGNRQITAQADGTYVLSELGDHVITATDYAGNSTTVTVIVKEHNFSGEMQSDESGHWKECQNEGCHQIDKKPHTPNIAAATETEDKVCMECNFIIEPKLGHLHKLHLESVKAKAATCIADGNKAYYRCTEDQQCFLDENAENPVELSDLIIPAAGHQTSDWIVDKEATITAEGSRHKECTVCGTVLETAVIEKIPMVSYDITEGANGRYTLNSDESYTICSNGEFAKFVNVEIDGKTVDVKYYTAKSGSTIVTFTKEYMNSLSVGEHVIKMNFTDGTAETTFVVAKEDSEKESAKNPQKEPQKTSEKDIKANTNANVTKSPQTGDSSHVTLWLAILAISGSIATGAVAMLRRKKKYTA